MPKAVSKFANARRGRRVDLGRSFRSAQEANLARVLVYLQRRGACLVWLYEQSDRLYFPGERRSANSSVWLDFEVRTYQKGRRPCLRTTWIEVKGMLPRGGWLPKVDLEPLRGRDDDSRVKLERLRRDYPHTAARVYLLGEREYKRLTRRFAHRIPLWEHYGHHASTTNAA